MMNLELLKELVEFAKGHPTESEDVVSLFNNSLDIRTVQAFIEQHDHQETRKIYKYRNVVSLDKSLIEDWLYDECSKWDAELLDEYIAREMKKVEEVPYNAQTVLDLIHDMKKYLH